MCADKLIRVLREAHRADLCPGVHRINELELLDVSELNRFIRSTTAACQDIPLMRRPSEGLYRCGMPREPCNLGSLLQTPDEEPVVVAAGG